jgi:hypothetical protein
MRDSFFRLALVARSPVRLRARAAPKLPSCPDFPAFSLSAGTVRWLPARGSIAYGQNLHHNLMVACS